jgi:hypothetical protein
MEPMNGYIMLKKRPAAERKSGLIVPEGGQAEEIESTGFDVIKVAPDVDNIKAGDVVFPGYDAGWSINRFVFYKSTHIVAIERAV